MISGVTRDTKAPGTAVYRARYFNHIGHYCQFATITGFKLVA